MDIEWQSTSLCALTHKEVLFRVAPGIHAPEGWNDMVRERQPEQLDLWLEQASTSDCPELVSFATGIKRDYAAVKAALHSPIAPAPSKAISID